MKIRFALFFLMAAVLILPSAARCAWPDTDCGTDCSDLVDTAAVGRALPDDARDLLEDADADDARSLFRRVLECGGEALSGIFGDAVRSAGALMIVALLCGVGTSVGTAGESASAGFVDTVGVLAAAAISAGQVGTFVGLAARTMDELNTFSKALLPTLTAACAFSGSTAAGAGKYAATMLCTDVLMTLANDAVFPLIFTYVGAAAASAAFGSSALDGAAKLIKWTCMTLISLVVMAFVTYLTVTGAAAGTADAAVTRFTKTAISSAVPVAGGLISDAASAVAGGMSALRSSVGIIGLAAVSAICLVPFLRLAVHYLIFKAAALLASCAAGERLAGFINAVGAAFGMALGVAGAGAIMLFVSIVSLMKVVTV